MRTQAAGVGQHVAQSESLVTDLRRQMEDAQVRMRDQSATGIASNESLKTQRRNKLMAVGNRSDVHVGSFKQGFHGALGRTEAEARGIAEHQEHVAR